MAWYRYDRALAIIVKGNTSDFESDLQTAIELAQNRLSTLPDKWQVSMELALYNLVGGNATDAEAQFRQLASASPLCSNLQGTVNILKDILSIQPSNESARYICTQLQDRIIELKRSPIRERCPGCYTEEQVYG